MICASSVIGCRVSSSALPANAAGVVPNAAAIRCNAGTDGRNFPFSYWEIVTRFAPVNSDNLFCDIFFVMCVVLMFLFIDIVIFFLFIL